MRKPRHKPPIALPRSSGTELPVGHADPTIQDLPFVFPRANPSRKTTQRSTTHPPSAATEGNRCCAMHLKSPPSQQTPSLVEGKHVIGHLTCEYRNPYCASCSYFRLLISLTAFRLLTALRYSCLRQTTVLMHVSLDSSIYCSLRFRRRWADERFPSLHPEIGPVEQRRFAKYTQAAETEERSVSRSPQNAANGDDNELRASIHIIDARSNNNRKNGDEHVHVGNSRPIRHDRSKKIKFGIITATVTIFT